MHSQDIILLHNSKIIEWKSGTVTLTQKDFAALVEQNHAFNYQLWHAEDRARRDDMGYEFVYLAKREIDQYNQQRNDRMEAMDKAIWEVLQPSEEAHCPVHSETPGMMIDRLSILALKAYHMHIQTTRKDADRAHHQRCAQKLSIILAQQKQLALCYDTLLQEVKERIRTFRVYHQFKMYNDPNLNPELYQHSQDTV